MRMRPSKWHTLIATCIGLLMLYIDLFIVNVALPTIGHDFHVPLSTISWTISGYVLMIGVLPMGIGRLGDIWGQRRVYMAGLVLFVTASLCCGLAPNITFLIIFRVIQGIGAAIMTPGTLALIIRAFPREQHGLAIGVYGGISGLGLVAGPVLGGLLVHGDSWRWIFFVNVPVGVVAIILALLFIPASQDSGEAIPVDWLGLLLLSTGLLFLLFGLTRAGDEGWFNPVVGGCGLVGIVLLALFIIVERRIRWPLIDLSLFRNLPFVVGCASFFLFSAALFGSQPYWSLFVQNTWGFTPLQGGLAFLPATVLVAVLTPFSGLIAQWAGRRLYLFLALGLLVLGLTFLYIVLYLTPQSHYVSEMLPTFIVRGFAIPIISSGATLAVVGAVSTKQSGLASGTLGMARNVGTAFGVAVLSQIYLFHIDTAIAPSLAASRTAASQFIISGEGASRLLAEGAIIQGFKLTGLACFVFCGCAVILALFMRPRSATPAVEADAQATPITIDG
jgi:MFS transporter, DHA2 family, methylenomycin A resistance protein